MKLVCIVGKGGISWLCNKFMIATPQYGEIVTLLQEDPTWSTHIQLVEYTQCNSVGHRVCFDKKGFTTLENFNKTLTEEIIEKVSEEVEEEVLEDDYYQLIAPDGSGD